MDKNQKIYVAGHTGLIGSALVRQLKSKGYKNLITATYSELNLKDSRQVQSFFEATKPDYVLLAAGKTGGLYAVDTYGADFIYENLMIQLNIIHMAFLTEAKKLVFFSCSSVYPKMAPQPMKEEAILSSSLEPTSEEFAITKIAGMKMCQAYNKQYGTDFLSVIPTNIYGINQKYEPLNSPVIPSLIRKFHKAKVNKESSVVIWGTGRPARDFLFADDCADACLFLLENNVSNEPINIGSGKDHTIRELAEIIQKTVGYEGEITYDTSKPDGVMTKLQDISKMNRLGWRPKVGLEEGIRLAYEDYLGRLNQSL